MVDLNANRQTAADALLGLIVDYQLALPLYPEYRTMPMVWYIPPLPLVVDILATTGHDGENKNNLFGAIDALRVPIECLAELFTAGDVGPVRLALQRLAAMRSYMRAANLGEEFCCTGGLR